MCFALPVNKRACWAEKALWGQFLQALPVKMCVLSCCWLRVSHALNNLLLLIQPRVPHFLSPSAFPQLHNSYAFVRRPAFHGLHPYNLLPSSIWWCQQLLPPLGGRHTAEPSGSQSFYHFCPPALSPEKQMHVPLPTTILPLNSDISSRISLLTWGLLCFIFYPKDIYESVCFQKECSSLLKRNYSNKHFFYFIIIWFDIKHLSKIIRFNFYELHKIIIIITITLFLIAFSLFC